jgi:AcrR family transcriptional regulator
MVGIMSSDFGTKTDTQFQASILDDQSGEPRSNRPISMDRKQPNVVSRRSLILGSALELFATQGYGATTMDEIGERVGIRGPSIYKHFRSKQNLLLEIMFDTMERLLRDFASAVSASEEVGQQLKLAVEAHVRYNARHRFEAFVCTREINSLTAPDRSKIIDLRAEYERGFRELIERGHIEGRFNGGSSRLASYAILDMGMGVAVWFRENGPFDEDQIAQYYGIMALRMLGGLSLT